MPNTGIAVLIVEDEAAVRDLLTELLSPRFQCSSAESAGEAIRHIQSQFFHLALVDIGLPGMSGLALCRLIVNQSPNTVVVVVSGNTDDRSVAESIKAGAADYITKPFDVAQAVATVERALERRFPWAAA